MKKRLLSLLMAFGLLLGLLPAVTAPAAAAYSPACVRYVHDMDVSPTESGFSNSPTLQLNHNTCVVFYANDNGNAGDVLEAPTFAVLGNSAVVEVTELDADKYITDQNHVIYELRPLDLGSGTLLIESNGVTYSMDYTVELPERAFYDSPDREAESYLPDEEVFYDSRDGQEQFYYLVDPAVGTTMLSARISDTPDGYQSGDLTLALDSAGKTLTFTIPQGKTPEGEFGFEITFGFPHNSTTFTDTVEITLVNDAPMLRFKQLYYDNDRPREEEEFLTSLSAEISYSSRIVLYYGTAEDAEPLQDFTITSNDESVARVEVLEDDAFDGDTKIPVRVSGRDLGSTTLTINCNGETYTLPVTVTLPDFALYTEQKASVSTLLEDELYNSKTDTVYYIMAEEGFEDPVIDELDIRKGDIDKSNFTFVERGTSGIYDVKLTIPKGTTGGVDFFLLVYDEAKKHGWGNSFQLEDHAPALRYAYVDYEDDEPYLKDPGETYNRYNQSLMSHPAMVFYYGTEDDVTPLTANSLAEAPVLTYTSNNGNPTAVEATPDALYSDNDHTNAVVYRLKHLALDEGTLSATVGGETYTMSARVGLPEFYPYTSRSLSAGSMLTEMTYESGKETILWLMTEEGHKTDTFDRFEVREGSASAELVERDNEPGVYDVKITIPATCRGTVRFNIRVDDGRRWNDEFRLQDTSPALFYNYILYGPNGEPFEDGNFESTRRQPLSGDCHVALYYGQADGTKTLITAANENSIPEITVTPVSGTEPTVEVYPVNLLDNGKVVYCIKALTLGDSILSYTVNGETYSMLASGVLPDVGFYTTKACTEETLVRNGQFDYTENTRTVYYQSLADGPEILNLELSEDNGVDYSDILTIRELSDKRWSVTVADDFIGQSDWIRFEIELNWGNNEIRTENWELMLISSAPLLYSRDYWVGWDGPVEGEPEATLTLWPGDNLDRIFYHGTPDDLTTLTGYTLEPADDTLLSVEQVGTHGVGGVDKPVYRVTALKAASPNAPTKTSLVLTLKDGTEYTYPITIRPLVAGSLYHRQLEWNETAGGYSLQEPGWLNSMPISMAPYMDMYAFALFYTPDGMTYEPVEGTVRSGTAFDAVALKTDKDGNPVTGWYEMSPFDFGSGYLDAEVNGKTYSLELETYIPFLGFYSEDSVSEDTFRMYQLMGKNPNAETDGFKYVTTLYVQPGDEDFSFSPYHLFVAHQKQYDENGMEIGTKEVAAGQFKAEILGRNADNNCLKVALYSNVGDLLVYMMGFDDESDMNAQDPWSTRAYGTYVNLLTPNEDSSLFVNLDNSHGFAASKFLPANLFEQAAELDSGVTVGSNKYPGTVHFDKNSTKNIMAELKKGQPVCIIMDHEPGTAPQDQAIDRFARKNQDIVTVVNLDLFSGGSPFGTSAQGGFTDNGVVTVTYPCQLDIPDGTEVDVYYLDDHNNVEEKLTGIYSDGVLTFQTTHFSSFAIATDTRISVPEEMLKAKNAQIFVAFYDDGAMVDLQAVPAGTTVLDASDLESGLTYRFFCMDANGHTPLTEASGDTI